MTASIEQPNPANGLGYWPAFWALGSPMRTGGGWPQSGEIDMMEDVNGLNEASQTFHNSANSPGHPLIACPGAGSGCQTGYHTYSVIVDRTNTSAETMQFLMDGVVESTITEASVGTAAWQAAVDHGFFIIFDLAMGGNYPDGISGTTTPTSATTSGASMSVGYVAVYEQGGNSTPTGTATATGTVTGLSGLCLANQNSLNTSGNPIGVTGCNGSAGQQWSPYSDGTLRTQGGCLDVVSAGTSSGTNVDWYPCNGTAAQNWTHQANGELVNPSSGLCLTDPGGNTSARLDIETCTDSAQQQWTLPTGSGGGGGGGGGTCGTTNLALNKTATASSTENAGTPAADAVDGNTGTRWSSAFSDPQWLEVDLGSSQAICQVTLNWEAAYAKAFQIQTSADGTNWTTIYSTTTGTGGTQTLNVTGTGRYIRMYGTARATQYGYSLWEFSVYGTGGSSGGGGTCGTTNLALNKTATASSTENAVPRRPTRWTATPAPAGPAPSPTRNGSRSTSARPRPSARSSCNGRPPTPPPSRSRPRPTAPTGPPSTPPLPDRRHPDPQRHRHRPLHPDVRHRPGHPVRVLAVGVPGLVANWSPAPARTRECSRAARPG